MILSFVEIKNLLHDIKKYLLATQIFDFNSLQGKNYYLQLKIDNLNHKFF